MDIGGNKLKQKAPKQPKQKKSKSAEFLREEEENDAACGIENPAFCSDGRETPFPQASGGRDVRCDRQDGALTPPREQEELQACAEPGGNDIARNDFDPPTVEEPHPRRRGMEAGTEDELELNVMKKDEEKLFLKMAELLNEDEATTIIDLPGTVPEGEAAGAPGTKAPLGRWGAAGDRGIPRYVEQLKESVQKDMIALGGSLLHQDLPRDPCQQEQILQDKIYATFQQAERQLEEVLRKRKGEVMAQYGELVEVTAQAESGLQWQVEWRDAPQPVEVHLRCLRAARDKLPQGHYGMSASLWNRLGGQALGWSHLEGHQSSRTSKPVEHRGRFHDAELHLNQSVFTVLPSTSVLLPSTVLQFELLSFPGEHSQIGSVVGWAAFPICDCSFNTIQGKFRVPLLRGRPSAAVHQFRRIEQLMASDLDNWLCNLYFQMKKLPRGGPGDDCTVTLLIPSPVPHLHPCPTRVDGEDQQPEGSALSLAAPSRSSSSASLQVLVCEDTAVCATHRLGLHDLITGKDSRGVIPEHARQTHDTFPLKAEPGTRHKKDPAGGIALPHMDPKEDALHGKQDAHLSLSAEEMEQYCFSVQAPHPCMRGAEQRGQLVRRMMLSELGLSPASPSELCLLVPLLALIWFSRLYLHYCSQWLFLQAIAVPVSKFQFHPHTVDLAYQNSLLHTREELAMVVVGPLTLNAAMLLLVLIRWGCQLIFGSFPSSLSKFIMALGVWTVLDPLAVFAVDAILGRLAYSAEQPIADAAKLAWHFHRTQHSVVPGILLTLFVYAVLCVCSITILYTYFLRWHNDGRMLDLFQRLHSPEGSFFVPQDMEVSIQELSYVVKKAEQWRGFNGERRKVAVYDYIWTTDPLACGDPPRAEDTPDAPPPQGETSTHVSIYTLHLSGFRQLHRHFLRQPDGAIVEVIGTVDSVGPSQSTAIHTRHGPVEEGEPSTTRQLRERRKKKTTWRNHRVEPAGMSCNDSAPGLQPSSR